MCLLDFGDEMIGVGETIKMMVAFLPALEQAISFNLNLLRSTLIRVVLIFFLILYFQNYILIGCCCFFYEIPICQTNSVFFAKTSSLLDILINSLLHLLRINISKIKLKVLFPFFSCKSLPGKT